LPRPTESVRLFALLTRIARSLTARVRLVPLWLAVASGCGEQEIRAIEALPLPSGSAPAKPDDPPGEADGGAAGAAGAAGAPSGTERERVEVRDGELVTDKGTRLRGVTLGIDVMSSAPVERELLSEMAEQSGLNAFHVYAGNFEEETGMHAAQVDELVEMTAEAGLYLVVAMGSGHSAGKFDLAKVRDFWTFYAPRYASRTHVLYEIQNIPDSACDVAFDDATLEMEREILGLIREHAPLTHVALFSFFYQPTTTALEANIEALGSDVDWSKASIAFHPQPCKGNENLADLLEVTRAHGIAAIASEMKFFTSYETTERLESERIGWFSFEWLQGTRDMSKFRESHAAAGISWCPDFGTWPEDSETCSDSARP
jgi:hypothetical protein